MRDRPLLNSARVVADLTEDGSWFQEWEIIYEKELWIWLEVFTGWETLRAEERNLLWQTKLYFPKLSFLFNMQV